MTLSRRFQADLALGLVSFIWGSTFVVVKAALADASPMVFVFVRFALAASILYFLFRRREPLWRVQFLRAGFVIGAFLCAGYLFQTVGLNYTSPAKSAFITSLSVVLVPVAMFLAFRQRLAPWAVGGVAAATLGLYFLTVPPGEFTVSRGDFITFFCALAFAGHIVAVGHYAPRFGVGPLAFWQVLVAFVLAGLLLPGADTLGWETLRLQWTPRLIGALVLTAAFATALAFSVQLWAQKFTSATHTAILFSLEPVFAALTSLAVFGERLGARGLLGAALIFAGVLLVELRPSAAPDVPGMPAPANPSGEDSV